MCVEGLTTDLIDPSISCDLLQLEEGAGKVSPRTSAWPGTHSVAQSVLELSMNLELHTLLPWPRSPGITGMA